jgi:hypothetical protein
MTSSLHYDRYGMSASRFKVMLCALGAEACGVALKIHGPLGYAVIAFTIIFLLLSTRVATITNRDGITIRWFLWTRKISWADIQDIRVKTNTLWLYRNQYTKETPKQLVMIYDRHGKQITLPNLNEETLGKGKPLDVEVQHIYSTWEQLRGRDWVPLPDVGKIIDKKQREPEWLDRFVLAFCLAFLVMFLGFLFLGLIARLPEVVWLWVLPLLTFLAVMFAPVMTRTRDATYKHQARK